MKAPHCLLLAICCLISGVILLLPAPLALALTIPDFDGPPRVVWDKPFPVSAQLLNDGDQPLEHITLQIVLSPDTKADAQDPILLRRELEPLAAGDSQRLSARLTLGGYIGWRDGDYYLIATAGTSQTLEPIHVESRDIDEKYVPRNYDLVGAQCSPAGMTPEWRFETFIRHCRWDVSWGEFEPERGEWNQEAFQEFGELLLELHNHDMTLLPTLSGCPQWAGVGWGPPNDPQDWYDFVDKVVGYFSQEPYYQQHWQIWNEAHIDTGFWKGESIEQYIDTIHNPGADAIRNHYVDRNENGEEDPGERCIVVYGGWPCNHFQGGEYSQVLAYHGAGERTDILDAHYMTVPMGLEWFEMDYSGQVYQKWVENGPAFGCWQTENGEGFAQDPYWLPQLYTHDLYWALNHNWHRPDQYREYFFHYYAAQPQRGFKWTEVKYPNYYSMRTFMLTTWGDLYLPGEGRKIEPSQGIAADPLLCGGRLVFLLKDYPVGEPVTVRVNLRPTEKVTGVCKIGVVWGIETPLRFHAHRDRLTFRVNTSGDEPHPEMCYIQITCAQPMTPMTDHE